MKYLILNQLGTPDAATPEAVGRYLSEFLMDRNVIGLPRPFRDILVKIGIVPRRKFASAKKYHEIWDKDGSPLAKHTKNQAEILQKELGPEWKVIVGMRYGNPSLKDALAQISKGESFVFLPLYPHWAQATVGSAIEKIKELHPHQIQIIEPFFEKDWFLKAKAEIIQKHLKPEDHLLLSYHGLPVSQEKRSPISYQAQCLKTTELLKKRLSHPPEKIISGFQSRVGVTKWIEPFTDAQVALLAEQGVKHLKVACPSFVADCLETLEEIAIGLKADFLAKGGESFELIPCLNSSEVFVKGLAQEIKAQG